MNSPPSLYRFALVILGAALPDGLPGYAQSPAPSLRLVEVATVKQPVYLSHAGDGSKRLFIVEKDGLIKIFSAGKLLPEPFLDTEALVSKGEEQGLLSVAFHPQFKVNGKCYVNYTNRKGDTVVAEYQAPDRQTVDPASARLIISIPQPYENHNGGQLKFGPDGYLYIGMGDGGSAGDPHGHGQNMRSLLGKMLRLDINTGAAYKIPPDNPFVSLSAVRPEIWASGLRNPWRFSFDPASGRLFAADVGQDKIEEVDIIERGKNYGWNIMEGSSCFKRNCSPSQYQPPIAEYDHSEGISITGGYVYRGKLLSNLAGRYLFGDFGTSVIWYLEEQASGRWKRRILLKTRLMISSFGEDEDGEVYVLDLRGGVYRLEAAVSEKR